MQTDHSLTPLVEFGRLTLIIGDQSIVDTESSQRFECLLRYDKPMVLSDSKIVLSRFPHNL